MRHERRVSVARDIERLGFAYPKFAMIFQRLVSPRSSNGPKRSFVRLVANGRSQPKAAAANTTAHGRLGKGGGRNAKVAALKHVKTGNLYNANNAQATGPN